MLREGKAKEKTTEVGILLMSCDHKVTTTAVKEKANWPDLVNVD